MQNQELNDLDDPDDNTPCPSCNGSGMAVIGTDIGYCMTCLGGRTVGSIKRSEELWDRLTGS